MSQKKLFIGAVVASASLLGACSSEQAVERLAEAQTGGDVDIDLDSGDIRVETEDGVFETATSAELPDDFPEAVPTPQGSLATASRTEIDGAVTYTLSYQQPEQNTSEYYGDLSARLEAAGYTKAFESTTDGAVTAQFTDDTWIVMFFGSDNDGGSEFQYIVGPAAES